MGGRDKGLIDYQGEPLAAHVARRLGPQVATLWINANRNQDTYACLADKVLSDVTPGFVGPLAGLETGLVTLAGTPLQWICTVPCDAPHLPEDLLARLAAAARQSGARVAIAATTGRLQPVFALVHISTLADLQRYLAQGERRVQAWYTAQPHGVADFVDDIDAFANLNQPDDLSPAPGQPG